MCFALSDEEMTYRPFIIVGTNCCLINLAYYLTKIFQFAHVATECSTSFTVALTAVSRKKIPLKELHLFGSTPAPGNDRVFLMKSLYEWPPDAWVNINFKIPGKIHGKMYT